MKNNIKKLRMLNGVTQSTLADYLGIARNTLSYWEQGKFDVDNTSLQKIADYFHCSVDCVLGREETSESFADNLPQHMANPQSNNNKPKNNIKKLRILKNITQTTLANYLGVAQNTLSNWEQGKFDVDNTSLQKIADYFHCSVDYVLGREETSEPAPSKTESHNTSEELMRKAQALEENGGGRRILAYGGTVEDDSLASKIKALERQRSHSRDEDSYLLFQTKRQESGAVLFGYDPNGKWVSKTLTDKEAEFVFNVIKSLENLT